MFWFLYHADSLVNLFQSRIYKSNDNRAAELPFDFFNREISRNWRLSLLASNSETLLLCSDKSTHFLFFCFLLWPGPRMQCLECRRHPVSWYNQPRSTWLPIDSRISSSLLHSHKTGILHYFTSTRPGNIRDFDKLVRRAGISPLADEMPFTLLHKCRVTLNYFGSRSGSGYHDHLDAAEMIKFIWQGPPATNLLFKNPFSSVFDAHKSPERHFGGFFPAETLIWSVFAWWNWHRLKSWALEVRQQSGWPCLW